MTTNCRFGDIVRGRVCSRSLAAGLVTAFCGLALILTPLGTTFERTFGLDWLFKVRGARQPPPDIAVVGINSRTGAALGLPRLPHDWSRTVHARLIERLVEQNAEGIVFDIDFSRPKPGDEDAILGAAIAEADRVVLFEWLAGEERTRRHTGGEVKAVGPGSSRCSRPWRFWPRLPSPWPVPAAKLDQAAFEFWAFKSSVGDAPTTAAVALQLKAFPVYDQWLAVLKDARATGVEHLPVHAGEVKGPPEMQQLMQSFVGCSSRTRPFNRESKGARPGRWRRRTDTQTPGGTRRALRRPRSLLHQFLWSSRHHPYHPLRVAAKEAPGDAAAGTAISPIIWSSSATPISTIRTSRTASIPVSPARTGSTSAVSRSWPPLMRICSASGRYSRAILAGGACRGGVRSACRHLGLSAARDHGVPAAFVFTALYAAGLQWQFNVADFWLPLATPVLVQLPLALMIGLMGQYLLERRKEEHLTRAIRYYLPENIVRDVTETRVDPATLNRVVFGTCLATDMSDFIALAETKPPRELAVFMNEYFDALAGVLKRHGVDVMEFRADMIMCAWIAPARSPRFAAREWTPRSKSATSSSSSRSDTDRGTSPRASDFMMARSMSDTPAAAAASSIASWAIPRTRPRGWRA